TVCCQESRDLVSQPAIGQARCPVTDSPGTHRWAWARPWARPNLSAPIGVLQKHFQAMELTSVVWKKLEGCTGDCQGFPQKRIRCLMTEAPGSGRMSGEWHAVWGEGA